MKKSIKIDSCKVELYEFGSGKPEVFIVAGIHGDEATGVYTAFRLVEFLQNKDLKGKVKIVPVANPPAFRRKTRTTPIDSKDLNRVFPGSKDGSFSDKLAFSLWSIAVESDYILDLHCCGLNCCPYILALHQEYSYVKEYVSKIPLLYCVESTGLRGQLFIEASHNKIPAAIIEVKGGNGTYDEEHSKILLRAVLSLLANLELIKAFKMPGSPVFLGKIRQMESPTEGFFKPLLAPGNLVDEGTVIGLIEGIPVEAGAGGVLISIMKSSYVLEKEKIANIAPLIDK